MDYVIGAVLAVGVCAYATFVRLDRDRAFYALLTAVIGSYYLLFAVMVEAQSAYVIEAMSFAVFIALASVGFRTNLWLVAAALLAHGLFDAVHPMFVDNPGVPSWWAAYCLGFDAAAAAYLAWLIVRTTGDRSFKGLMAAGASYGRTA